MEFFTVNTANVIFESLFWKVLRLNVSIMLVLQRIIRQPICAILKRVYRFELEIPLRGIILSNHYDISLLREKSISLLRWFLKWWFNYYEVNPNKCHLIFRGSVVRITNIPNVTTVNPNYVKSPDINLDKI